MQIKKDKHKPSPNFTNTTINNVNVATTITTIKILIKPLIKNII